MEAQILKKLQNLKKVMVILLIIVFEMALFFVANAYAQEKEKILYIDEISITATRNEKAVVDIPNTVHILSGQEIQREKLPASLPEFLKDIPGIMVQKTSHGQGSPFIRGFTGFHNLFLIDGIRFNNSVFREGPNQYWNTVDPFSVEKLEVIKGAGSVLYGSDAIGGVVNALTLSPKEYEEGDIIATRLYYRYAGAENTNIGHIEVNGNMSKKTGYVLGGSLKNFGDIHAGGDIGRQKKTGYDEYDGDIKIQHFFNTDSKIILAHQQVSQDDIWRTHKTIYGISWEGTTIGDEKKRILDQDRELTYIQYHGNNLCPYIDVLKLSLSFHVQEEEQYRIKSNDSGDRQGFEVETVGFFNQMETQTSFGDLVYGFDLYHDMVESFLKKYNADGSLKSVEIQGPVADDSTYDTFGIFLQNDIKATPKLNFILGIRYAYAKVDADKVQDPKTGNEISFSENWSETLGSVKALYHLDNEKHWNLFAGVSQGFRAPNLSDLTRFDTARSNEIETPSPDLDPEKFISSEIGLKNRFEKFSFDAAYFYTLIDDMIIRTPTGDLVGEDSEVTKKNAGAGYVNGLELDVRYQFSQYIATFGAFTWMYGAVDTYPTSMTEKKKEPIDRLLPTTGNLGIRVNCPNKKYWIEAVSTLAAEQDNLSTSDERDTQRIPPSGTPGYSLLSLRSGWMVRENINISAALENITDEDYRIHGSGVNEPGRNFIVALDIQF